MDTPQPKPISKKLKTAVGAFFNYLNDSNNQISRIRRDYESLPSDHQDKLLYNLDQRITSLTSSARSNYEFFIQIAHPHKELFSNTTLVIYIQPDGRVQISNLEVKYKNIKKTRAILRQITKEWSQAGAHERNNSYSFILEELKTRLPLEENTRVVIPSCGLGRLLFEVAKLGYECEGYENCEFRKLVCEHMLWNTEKIEQFKVYPYIHDFTNLLKYDQIFQEVTVPDIKPKDHIRLTDVNIIKGSFLDFYPNDLYQVSCIITYFCIDTAPNIIQYIETIYNSLKPGGIWINYGPLIYTYTSFKNESAIQLTWEEFRHVISSFNFCIEREEELYTIFKTELNPMMEVKYRCNFMTARKVS